MYNFSETSKKRLSECVQPLQDLFNEVIKRVDCTILCGQRGEKEQNEAYAKGNSKLKFPQSKHNKFPSQAVDVAPYPIDWNDINRFKLFSVVVFDCASTLGITVEWGGSWQSLKDYPHWQIN